MTHNFTDRKPWVATEEDCKAPWSGRRDGTNFKCRFCGHKFAPGDVVRWEFTNDTKGAGGNPLICVGCDGTREEIIAKVIDLNKGSDVLRVERDALRAEVEQLKKWQREMVEKAAAKSLDGYRELGAKCASLEEERDRWHGSWKNLHNERQELRGVLGVPIPPGEGTVIQEFDPRYPLLESAKKIVKERDEARAEVEHLKTDIAAEKGWTSKYQDAHCAALEKELDATIAEVKRTGEKAEKYHQIMEALKRSKLEHGRCDSPGHKACTRCMAEAKIAQLIAEYKGRNIVIARMGLPDEKTLAREQVQEHLRDAGIDMEKAQAKLKDVLKKQEDKP